MRRKLVCIAKGELAWQEYEDAPLQPGQVRVLAEFAAAKHGTEMAFYKGYANPRGPYDPEFKLHRPERERSPYPFNIGNMLVGPVIEAGPGVTRVALGERVCVYSGFSETRVVHEDQCWKMSPAMSWKTAVCLDPAEFAFAAVRDGHVRLGDAVAVFGMGAIGLMAVQLARLAGASQVIALDPLPNRRALAEQLGATLTLDPTACDAGLEIKKATDKRGADVIIDYSGAMPAVQHALRGIAYGGNVVLGSFPPAYGAGLDLGAEAHMNVPNIIFSRACSQPDRDHPRWDEPRIFRTVWSLLCGGALTGEPVVQPVVARADLPAAYADIASHPEKNVKLGVIF
ncbi:MAG: zinc-binding dehydrogenase [Chloroflexota bacterium]